MSNNVNEEGTPGTDKNNIAGESTQMKEIREHQKETWNNFSPGWKKWDDFVIDFLKPQGDEMIRLLNLTGNELILDVASGTGDPGLSIAASLNSGKVILTDLSEGMLAVASENAAKRGITNIEVQVSDACNLPFADNTFDSISCRLGFMFFPDMELAAKEFLRVLKPGGKIVTTVWAAPENNFWATAALSVVNKNMNMPAPPPGSPGLYRCSAQGMLSGILSNAGFKDVSESEVKVNFDAKTSDVYWAFITDVVAPVVWALKKADDETRAKIKSEVLQSVLQKYPEGEIAIEGSSYIIYGVK